MCVFFASPINFNRDKALSGGGGVSMGADAPK